MRHSLRAGSDSLWVFKKQNKTPEPCKHHQPCIFTGTIHNVSPYHIDCDSPFSGWYKVAVSGQGSAAVSGTIGRADTQQAQSYEGNICNKDSVIRLSSSLSIDAIFHTIQGRSGDLVLQLCRNMISSCLVPFKRNKSCFWKSASGRSSAWIPLNCPPSVLNLVSSPGWQLCPRASLATVG